MGLHRTPLSGRRLLLALKALLRCSRVGCSAGALAVAGWQKTSPSQAAVLIVKSVFRSRGNPARPLGHFRSFSVLVPGAMGLAGPQYRELAFWLGVGMNCRVTGI